MNTTGGILKRVEYVGYELNLGVLGVRDALIIGQADRMMDGKIEVIVTHVLVGNLNLLELITLDQFENMKARLALSYIDPRVGA